MGWGCRQDSAAGTAGAVGKAGVAGKALSGILVGFLWGSYGILVGFLELLAQNEFLLKIAHHDCPTPPGMSLTEALSECAYWFSIAAVISESFQHRCIAVCVVVAVVLKTGLLWVIQRGRKVLFKEAAVQTERSGPQTEEKGSWTDPNITHNLHGVVYHGRGGGKRQLV